MAKITIDSHRPLAQRKAVKAARDRLFITTRRYRQGTTTYRVLTGGELYDVDERQLEALQTGNRPPDIDLDPIERDQ